MLALVKAELYKATHRPYFYGLLLPCLVLPVVLAGIIAAFSASVSEPISAPDVWMLILMCLPMGLFLLIFGADLVFSDQYKNNTLKNEVSFGHPRAYIYLSKLIAAALLLTLLVFVMLAVFGCFTLLLLEPSTKDQLEQSLSIVLMQVLGFFPTWLGGLALMTTILFLIPNSTAASGLYTGVLIFFPPVLHHLGNFSPLFQLVYQATPMHWTNLLMDQPGFSWSFLAQIWGMGLLWVGLFSGVGIALFSRKNL